MNRKCSNPRETTEKLTRIKQEDRVLRRELQDAIAAEKKFLRRR